MLINLITAISGRAFSPLFICDTVGKTVDFFFHLFQLNQFFEDDSNYASCFVFSFRSVSSTFNRTHNQHFYKHDCGGDELGASGRSIEVEPK